MASPTPKVADPVFRFEVTKRIGRSKQLGCGRVSGSYGSFMVFNFEEGFGGGIDMPTCYPKEREALKCMLEGKDGKISSSREAAYFFSEIREGVLTIRTSCMSYSIHHDVRDEVFTFQYKGNEDQIRAFLKFMFPMKPSEV